MPNSLVAARGPAGFCPSRWRGGRLKELPKKGVQTDCYNFRGRLNADHLSKMAASILDDTVEDPYM